MNEELEQYRDAAFSHDVGAKYAYINEAARRDAKAVTKMSEDILNCVDDGVFPTPRMRFSIAIALHNSGFEARALPILKKLEAEGDAPAIHFLGTLDYHANRGDLGLKRFRTASRLGYEFSAAAFWGLKERIGPRFLRNYFKARYLICATRAESEKADGEYIDFSAAWHFSESQFDRNWPEAEGESS